MAEPLTFRGVTVAQVHLLQGLTAHLARKALTGSQGELEALFACQDRLEHWLHYLSPVATLEEASYLEAPPPMFQSSAPGLTPAPDLQAFGSEDGLRPRVQFPPEPLFAQDLEREEAEP